MAKGVGVAHAITTPFVTNKSSCSVEENFFFTHGFTLIVATIEGEHVYHF